MNYATIKYSDISNGSGVRTCLFVSGCTHHCKGCFNEEAWDFTYGNAFDRKTQLEIIESLKPAYITGLSLLGGEPMEPANQRALVEFLEEVKRELPSKTIWCYSGYTYDVDLVEGGRAYTEVTDRILATIEVIVDGKFEQELYDISLRFRGSSNQRLIDVKESIMSGNTKIWQDKKIYATRQFSKL